jgi:hypothetical protein
VWIVQELSGGKGRATVLCGRHKFDWVALSALAKRIQGIYKPHAPYALDRMIEVGRSISWLDDLASSFDSPELPFPDYLFLLVDRDCEDPRDRFFGTIDLIDWERFGQTRPIPDYQVTSLELSFDLLHRTGSPTLDHAVTISLALKLQFDTDMLSDIQSMSIQCSTRRWYGTRLFGARKVEQDVMGRLKVDLHHETDAMYNGGVPLSFGGPEYHPSLLTAHGVVPLYTDGKASALVSACVRAGDVLLFASETVLLLRCLEGESRLIIIGAAILAATYKANLDLSPDCVRLERTPRAVDGYAFVNLCLEISDSTALQSATARPGHFDGRPNSDRIFSYLKHHAIGTAMAHTGAGSPSTSRTQGTRTLNNGSAARSQQQNCTSCMMGCNPIWDFLRPDEEGEVFFGH